jgi:2-haloacid dehalogenase
MPVINSDTKKIILLDVYETLLDMQSIKRKINTLVDSKRAYMHWFDLLMQFSLVDNSTGSFHSFPKIAEATLKMAGKDLGKEVSREEVDDIMYHLGHLPVHEGVSENLSRLKDAGFRLAAITNTPKNIIIGRMERTGLVSYFETILCADDIRKYKPATEVYTWALKKLNISNEEVLYVSAHGWDVIGAMHAGIETVYLEQAELLYYPLAKQPTYKFKNFDKFVQACVAENVS